MSNSNEMIGETRYTDAGEYTIVVDLGGGGYGDNNIALYLGRAADGHHDMIASDNASMWVVGDDNDAVRNYEQWRTIAACCDVAPVIDEVRKIDGDLADWLDQRHDEACCVLRVGVRSNYDADGEDALDVYYPCMSGNVYDAIAEQWDNIYDDCVVSYGLGNEVIHLAQVDGDVRTIDGLQDLTADYYAAIYDRECGDGDCGDWEYYSADGRHLTGEEAFGA